MTRYYVSLLLSLLLLAPRGEANPGAEGPGPVDVAEAEASPGLSPTSASLRAGCRLAAIARVGLSSVYGSCDASRAVLGRKDQLQLADVCGAPANFALANLRSIYQQRANKSCGAKIQPSYSQTGARLKITGRTIDLAPDGKNDCSAMIMGVLARAGLLIRPGTPAQSIFSTQQMIQWDQGNTCFKSPVIDAQRSIQPGDIVVARIGGLGHTFMVDRAGEDPFGLRKIKSLKDCAQAPDVRNWNFTIIESTGKTDPSTGRQAGASIWRASDDYLQRARAPHLITAYRLLFRNACEAKFRKTPKPFDQSGAHGVAVKLLRHSQTKACLSPKPMEFKGENCVRSCAEDIAYGN